MNTKAEKAAMHVMTILADNTPHGPTEYEQCLKVVTEAISSHFPEPSVPVSELEALRKQRDAALRLPQYAIYRDEFASWMIVNESKMFDQCIKDRGGPYIEYDELRAIFAPKEGK